MIRSVSLKHVSFVTVLAVAGAVLAACGGSAGTPPTGGGSGGAGHGGGGHPQSNASIAVAFNIDAFRPSIGKMDSATSKGTRSPDYISLTSAKGYVILDGSANVALTIPPNFNGIVTNPSGGPTPAPTSCGSGSLPNGGSASCTISAGPNYDTVSISLTTTPGQHTIGLALLDSNNALLSEGQTLVTLQSGTNGTQPLFLNGVASVGFLCNWGPANPAATWCSGGAGTANNAGAFELMTFAADADAWAIPYQQDGNGNPVLYDNGSWYVTECDNAPVANVSSCTSSGTLKIAATNNAGVGSANALDAPGEATCYESNPGPSWSGTCPGGSNLNGTPPYWVSGNVFYVSCNNVGPAAIAMFLSSSDASGPTINGLAAADPTAIYPQPGTALGQDTWGNPSSNPNIYEGNGEALSVNCTSQLVLEAQ